MGKQDDYEPLLGYSFFESFLMEIEQPDFPNDFVFVVWSPRDGTCYRIATHSVLEYHFARCTPCRANTSDGIALNDIYVSRGSEFEYWSERIADCGKSEFYTNDPPICIEFTSTIFGNRERQPFVGDRNMGLLVVCQSVDIEEDGSYRGPTPTQYGIPSR